MARPPGSKSKTRRPTRLQYQIRLTAGEHAAQTAHAESMGLTWGEWARHVLRQGCGLPALASYETPTKQAESKKD